MESERGLGSRDRRQILPGFGRTTQPLDSVNDWGGQQQDPRRGQPEESTEEENPPEPPDRYASAGWVVTSRVPFEVPISGLYTGAGA